MLSRLASRGSYGWLFAAGLTAGVALAASLAPSRAKVAEPDCVVVRNIHIQRAVGVCTEQEELAHATAVIHFFENEVQYATAADPMAAKADALLALPRTCESRYSYPALSKHVESAARVAIERDDLRTARQLVDVGRAYRVDPRMLDSVMESVLAPAPSSLVR